MIDMGLGLYLGSFLGYPSVGTAFTPISPFHTVYASVYLLMARQLREQIQLHWGGQGSFTYPPTLGSGSLWYKALALLREQSISPATEMAGGPLQGRASLLEGE